MLRQRNLLIVLADGEHVRFVREAENNALHSKMTLASDTAHMRSAGLGSDHPGASFHTGCSVRHVLIARHDPHALEKAKFAHQTAMQLNAREASGAFDELIHVAPLAVLNAIRGALSSATAARLIETLPKDLFKVPDHDLWLHLRMWVRPVQRSFT